MNYILFGGTFDPIHNGHVRIASAASLKLNADVIFIPARSPRWKTPLTTYKERLAMLKLAIKQCPSGTTISDFEIKSNADINYTIDTVRHFKKKYPKDKLYLLIGADQVNRFSEWKNAEEIANLAQITFVSRPSVKLDQNVIKTYHMLDLSFLESGDVSSTSFREMKSIDIPEKVLDYIEKHKLYFFSKLEKILPKDRLEHCIQVANLSLRIAKVNKLPNLEKYYFAGLLHDVGKTYYKEDENMISLMKKYYPQYINFPSFSYHQFIGEHLANEIFGIEDKEILEAIKYHCTGNENMSTLGMVVYTSDKIEPTRGFDSRWLINSCLANYKQGFIDTLIDNKKYLLAHNKDITNDLTDKCFEMYLPKELNNEKR